MWNVLVLPTCISCVPIECPSTVSVRLITNWSHFPMHCYKWAQYTRMYRITVYSSWTTGFHLRTSSCIHRICPLPFEFWCSCVSQHPLPSLKSLIWIMLRLAIILKWKHHYVFMHAGLVFRICWLQRYVEIGVKTIRNDNSSHFVSIKILNPL